MKLRKSLAISTTIDGCTNKILSLVPMRELFESFSVIPFGVTIIEKSVLCIVLYLFALSISAFDTLSPVFLSHTIGGVIFSPFYNTIVCITSAISTPTFFGTKSSIGNALCRVSSKTISDAVPLNSGGMLYNVFCNFSVRYKFFVIKFYAVKS
jgi:hypothetical protein